MSAKNSLTATLPILLVAAFALAAVSALVKLIDTPMSFGFYEGANGSNEFTVAGFLFGDRESRAKKGLNRDSSPPSEGIIRFNDVADELEHWAGEYDKFVREQLDPAFAARVEPLGGLDIDPELAGQLENLKGSMAPAALARAESSLLRTYSDPIDRGRAYSRLAEVYRLTQDYPRAVENIERALECPLLPAQRMQLYYWWGQCIPALNGRPERQENPELFAKTRREKIQAYLRGLKVRFEYEVPDPVPAPTYPNVIESTVLPNDPVAQQEAMDELHRREEVLSKARGYIRICRSILNMELGLRQAIIGPYSYAPKALDNIDELRQLAGEILGNDEAVEQLVREARYKAATRN